MVVTWRSTAREWVPGPGDSRGVACLGVVTLSKRLVIGSDGAKFRGLAVLLIIGGFEQNPGPVMEVENTSKALMCWVRQESKVGNPM